MFVARDWAAIIAVGVMIGVDVSNGCQAIARATAQFRRIGM